jgi:hypothetical protein
MIAPIDQIKVTGYPFLVSQMEELKNTPKKKYQILFLSQGTIGNELSAYQLASIMPGYEIVYKLHPGEYGSWQNYQHLIKAKGLENFRVEEGDSSPLHYLLAESEFQVGVSSFAIFEGLAYNCKTILVDLPGIEHMEYLLTKQHVMHSKNGVDLAGSSENFKVRPLRINHFFQTKKDSASDK